MIVGGRLGHCLQNMYGFQFSPSLPSSHFPFLPSPLLLSAMGHVFRVLTLVFFWAHDCVKNVRGGEKKLWWIPVLPAKLCGHDHQMWNLPKRPIIGQATRALPPTGTGESLILTPPPICPQTTPLPTPLNPWSVNMGKDLSILSNSSKIPSPYWERKYRKVNLYWTMLGWKKQNFFLEKDI